MDAEGFIGRTKNAIIFCFLLVVVIKEVWDLWLKYMQLRLI